MGTPIAASSLAGKYPDMSKRKLSKKPKQVNKQMEDAHAKAKTVLANETLRKEALLRLHVTRNKLYTALIKAYFQPAKQNA